MIGAVCLQGGGEFSVACRPMDAEVVRLGGPVVVTALAGAPGREYATANANGVTHYRAVGAGLNGEHGEVPEVLGAPDVRDDPQDAVEVLRRARLLVLPGGSPARLLAVLQSTAVGQLVTDLFAAGGTVVGSSAGAMVLGEWTVLPESGPTVVRGLGLVPGVVVVPHWTASGRGDWLRAVSAAVPTGARVLGLPEASGVLLSGGTCRALGVHPTRLVNEGRDLPPGATTAW